MNSIQPSVMLNGSTLLGRIYGQSEADECGFQPHWDGSSQTVIQVTVYSPDPRVIRMPNHACLVVQLFQYPDALWLAKAIHRQDAPMIAYSPIAPLKSLDDSNEMPALAHVSWRQLGVALDEALNGHFYSS